MTWRTGSRKGAVLPLAAVSLVSIMGVLALAADAGALHRQRRIAQTAADAGAVAAAHEIFRGRDDLVFPSATDETARNRFTQGVDGAVITVNHGPASGYFAGNTQFVEVIVSRRGATLFGALLGSDSVTVSARAVAGADAPSQNCLYTLDPSSEKALNVSGSTSRLDLACTALVNSRSSKAVLIESGGTLVASGLGVTGSIDQSGGNVIVSGSTETGMPPSPDPLASLPRPSFDENACDYTNTKVDNAGVTLAPGIYCGGIEITSNGSALLSPGLFILRGGGLKMGGGIINGTGVTFFNTNATPANGGADKFGKIELGSASRANLSSMTSGELAGILFFQDPLAGKPGDVYENVIASGSNAVFTGTLYFPTQPIELGASGSTTTINGGVVATTVTVTSGSVVTITGAQAGPNYFALKRVSLVE